MSHAQKDRRWFLHAAKGRRSFLSLLAKAQFTVIGLCLAIPGLAYFGSVLRGKKRRGDPGGDFVDAGAVADLPIGGWRLLTVQVMHEDGWEKTHIRCSVWVRRDAVGDPGITVLSPICPHLGCHIGWHPDQAQFICPCHKGTFDDCGRKIGGPSPRTMDPLPFEVHAGRLWVKWQDFKTGVVERIPLDA